MKHARTTKTNAARLLDSLGIVYETRTYEVDPDDLTAISVARKIGMPPEQVFKTLLTKVAGAGPRETTHFFAAIPGDAELDLKKLAHAADVKKVELASLKDVEPLTGYVRGGVTVFAATNGIPRRMVDEISRTSTSIFCLRRASVVSRSSSPRPTTIRAAGAKLADPTKAAQSPEHGA